MKAPFIVLLGALVMSLGTSEVALGQNRNWGANDVFVPGELLVKFKPTAAQGAIGGLNAQLGARTIRVLRRIGVHHVETSLPVLDAVRAYRSLPEVEYAEPNYIQRRVNGPQLSPNDPRYPDLWGLNNTGQGGGTPDADIDAPEAWGVQTGSKTVVVAVIDTGRFDHVDLVGNRWTNPAETAGNGVDDDGNGFIDDLYGWNFFGDNKILFGSDGCNDAHGTHTAGTIGAVGNNGTGVVGVNWNVSIMSLKFLGGPSCTGSTSDAIAAINYAADNGAHLTSNSWGGGPFSQALSDAIEAAGILFVAAAGNNGSDNDFGPFYPCNYLSSNVICVAATTRTDDRSGFSNFGARSVHLGAPGSSILSTTPNDTYSLFNGTSMATPHVAGVAALLYAEVPGISAAEVKCRILQNVDSIPALWGMTVTGGRLNAFKSLTNECLQVAHTPDHFLCYKDKTSPGTPRFAKRFVSLEDQFESGFFTVIKPLSLCNPADKQHEGILDADTHLEGYQIKGTHTKRTRIQVANQFGTILVDTIKADRLLVPTSKSLVGPIAPPNPVRHGVDHFKCHTVKVSPKTPKFTPITGVSIDDQFVTDPGKRFDLKKLTRLCTPVSKNGEGIKNPDAHLLCYQAKPAKHEPKHLKTHVFVNNQFGPEQLLTIAEEELCVPSTKTLP